jgi:quinol monooxygenase YgiN
VDHTDPGHFIFIEQWPDQDALDAHCQSEHFRRLVPLINARQSKACTFIMMQEF